MVFTDHIAAIRHNIAALAPDAVCYKWLHIQRYWRHEFQCPPVFSNGTIPRNGAGHDIQRTGNISRPIVPAFKDAAAANATLYVLYS